MNTHLNFKILHLTDIHGEYLSFPKIENDLAKADLIILSGDITHFGKWKEAREVITQLENFNSNLIALRGNCDYPEVENYLNQKCININQRLLIRNEVQWCGLGGSLPCPGKTPFEFTEVEALKHLEILKGKINPSLPLIFVSHQPPNNTEVDRLSNGSHIGSQSVRNFISACNPILCLTGHIHESAGICLLNHCTIVNPGPFSNGKYAKITFNGENSVNVELKQITC